MTDAPIDAIARVRAAYNAGRVSRSAALERLRSMGLQMTEVGLADLLDNDPQPEWKQAGR